MKFFSWRFLTILLTIVCACSILLHAAGTYTTSFPNTENPISESGKWTGGQSAGGNLWGDMETTPGFIFGASQPTAFGDPLAILTGSWGTTQTATATVKVTSTPANGVCCAEVELHVRQTIGASSITGYEGYCSVVPGNQYCYIAGWGGSSGVFMNLTGGAFSSALTTGDVMKLTASGANPTTVTLYVNNTQVRQFVDDGTTAYNDSQPHGPWLNGSMGVGVYTGGVALNTYGFSAFTGTDGTSNPPASPVFSKLFVKDH